MLPESAMLVQLEHYKDLLREAERERRARLAISAPPAKKTEKKIKIGKGIQRVEAPDNACCPA